MSSIYYTNAPKDYDYWFVKEVDSDVGRLTSGIDTDRPVRKIDLSEAGEFQRMTMADRYLSGLYPMIPEHQWQEWLTLGFATANEVTSPNCPKCHGLGTVPNTDATSLNVRMKCPNCEKGE